MSVDRPVIGLDIDGTLGDYHRHFTTFASAFVGRELPDPAAINPGLPLYKHLGISRAMYREIKLCYRRGGLKRSMPCYDGASELTHWLRSRTGGNADIWICTTRPYLRFDGIDPDTRHWLRRNRIQWDGVLFGERKYKDLVASVGHRRIVTVVDDLPEVCEQAFKLDLEPIIRDQPYNSHYWEHGISRAYSMIDLRTQLGFMLKAWRYENG